MIPSRCCLGLNGCEKGIMEFHNNSLKYSWTQELNSLGNVHCLELETLVNQSDAPWAKKFSYNSQFQEKIIYCEGNIILGWKTLERSFSSILQTMRGPKTYFSLKLWQPKTQPICHFKENPVSNLNFYHSKENKEHTNTKKQKKCYFIVLLSLVKHHLDL